MRPKALCPVWGESLLDRWIHQAVREGFQRVVVNAHHLPEKLVEHFHVRQWPIPVDVLVEKDILGTGGGVRNALGLLGNAPFVVVNADVAARVSLHGLLKRHQSRGAAVTMLLCRTSRFDSVAVNAERTVVTGFFRSSGFSPTSAYGQQRPHGDRRLWTFTGIQVVEPSALRCIPQGTPFHIIDLYQEWIAQGTPPAALCDENLWWHEVGSLESYWDVHVAYEHFRSGGDRFLSVPASGRWIHPTATVDTSVLMDGTVVIGSSTSVGRGCILRNVVIWDRCVIRPMSVLENCILTDAAVVSGRHQGTIFMPSGEGIRFQSQHGAIKRSQESTKVRS